MTFVSTMARLARLASVYQKAAEMNWTAFDDLSFNPEVSKIRLAIKVEEIDLHEVDSLASEQNPDFHQNRYHCVEA